MTEKMSEKLTLIRSYMPKYAAFSNSLLGMKPEFAGFTKDVLKGRPDLHLAPVDVEQTVLMLVNELEAMTMEEATERLDAFVESSDFVLAEGEMFKTEITFHGPFSSREQAREAARDIQVAYTVQIIGRSGMDEDRVDRIKSSLKPWMAQDSMDYHRVMQALQDVGGEHGTCQPRSRHACTPCNAQDTINEMLADYRGPRIVAS